MGAGLADPDGVLVEPFVFVADAEPTESREGRDGVDVVTRRVGMRVCVPSSNQKVRSLTSANLLQLKAENSPLLLSDKLEPCLEPLALSGLEFGFELPREPPGVIPVLRMGFGERKAVVSDKSNRIKKVNPLNPRKVISSSHSPHTN